MSASEKYKFDDVTYYRKNVSNDEATPSKTSNSGFFVKFLICLVLSGCIIAASKSNISNIASVNETIKYLLTYNTDYMAIYNRTKTTVGDLYAMSFNYNKKDSLVPASNSGTIQKGNGTITEKNKLIK